MFAVLGIIGALFAGYSYVTNPFTKLSWIRLPFRARMLKLTIEVIDNNRKLRLRQGWGWRALAVIKCGLYVVVSRYVHSPRSRADSVEGIIADIHQLRFDPSKLLVISGDHFVGLYVRNLGVFYYPLLDPMIPSTKTDWQNRQLVYLQSVAYALGVYAKRPVPTTTIVSAGPLTATCVNFYAYPSDTVYGILYALATLVGEESSRGYYGKEKSPHHLQSVLAAQSLRRAYRPTLVELYRHYRTAVYDEATGLIRTDLHLSGAKDITRRQGAFYDNVIFWKTTQLAMRARLIDHDESFLTDLKRRIIEAFWHEEGGYFLEDSSEEGRAGAYYSSDWLVVLFSNFLSIDDPTERVYFERSVAYIQEQAIDQPFGLKYHHDTRAHRQFGVVRWAVASYGGDAIWSFWGMEYIKCLLLLYRTTKTLAYLDAADRQIIAYQEAMLRDGGFPEVYDPNGRLLQTPLYRSIRQTGWVIGFEQVVAMRAAIKSPG